MRDDTGSGADEGRIVPLEQMRGDLVEGERDLEGWHVLAGDGTRVGEVGRVLVDADARSIRYLDVDLEDYLVPGRRTKRVLIPMTHAQVFDEGETVLMPRLRGEDIVNLPPYADEPITREYELELRDRVADDIEVEPIEEQGFLGLPGKQDRDAAG